MCPTSLASHSYADFLTGPLRAFAEKIEQTADDALFKQKVDELHGLSDAELSLRGLTRMTISHHVFTQLSQE